MADDSQLILELLFLQRRGGCSLTVLLFFLMLVGTCCFKQKLEIICMNSGSQIGLKWHKFQLAVIVEQVDILS